MPPLLDIDRVAVAYGDQQVLDAISIQLAQGEIGCLLGPSGCGKTSLLRAIAGFQPVTGGAIAIAGRMVSRIGSTLPPEQRRVGMVFQDLALFPHLSIADNIAFGLRSWSRGDRDRRIDELLELVGLRDYRKAWPHELSGGQQQRIALARALAPRPPLLLLDEPFSGLDVELREELAREVRGILQQEGTTAMLVTHDQLEAYAFADRIGLLHSGRLQQWDTPYNLYHRPASRVVAGFVGQGQLLRGRVRGRQQVACALGLLDSAQPLGLPDDASVEVLVRPDDILHAPDDSGLTATVVDCTFRGAEYLYTLRLATGEEVLCLTPSHDAHAPGTTLPIRVAPAHLVVFPA